MGAAASSIQPKEGIITVTGHYRYTIPRLDSSLSPSLTQSLAALSLQDSHDDEKDPGQSQGNPSSSTALAPVQINFNSNELMEFNLQSSSSNLNLTTNLINEDNNEDTQSTKGREGATVAEDNLSHHSDLSNASTTMLQQIVESMVLRPQGVEVPSSKQAGSFPSSKTLGKIQKMVGETIFRQLVECDEEDHDERGNQEFYDQNSND